MGTLGIYDAIIGDGDVVPPRIMGRLTEARTLAQNNTTKYFKGIRLTEKDAWRELQTTFKILRAINPEAEKWIRDCYASGRFHVDMSDNGMYASFDCIDRSVKLRSSFFKLNDGEKACVLSHEWRHSKQNPYKFAKLILSFMITRKLNTDIVENDAYLYEMESYNSLFNTGPQY